MFISGPAFSAVYLQDVRLNAVSVKLDKAPDHESLFLSIGPSSMGEGCDRRECVERSREVAREASPEYSGSSNSCTIS